MRTVKTSRTASVNRRRAAVRPAGVISPASSTEAGGSGDVNSLGMVCSVMSVLLPLAAALAWGWGLGPLQPIEGGAHHVQHLAASTRPLVKAQGLRPEASG